VASIDHLVVAARTLDEGSRWIEERLGARPVPGGKHAAMGTHNRLLALGGRVYLEVIAIDPDAPAPPRPRWFALDTPEMQERLEQGPALIHWVARTDSIEADVRNCPDAVEILSLSRGEYRWRIGVPADGHIPCGGRCATLIQWDGPLHPSDRLPESGCRLVELETSGTSPRAVVEGPRGRARLE
jgi:hypothetical protein